jgi:flagellar hook assembly protein FlgD
LAPGIHHIDLRAWDVHNNSSTVGLDFVVVESLEVFLDEVLAYPNPSNGPTTFQFLHNQACVPLEITLRIYDNAGRLVWSDTQERISEGNRMDHLNWNGTNRGGNPLTQGTYVYHLQVTTPEGRTADLTQRLVLLQ